jgi:tetratricopeptide (TPR) repeat protein
LVLYALNRLGTLESDQPEGLDTAERMYKEGLSLAREAGNREREAAALHNLGVLTEKRGDYLSSRTFFLSSLEIDRDMGMTESVAFSLNALASTNLALGDLQAAWSLIQEALPLAQRLGALPTILWIIVNFARLRAMSGDVERALVLFGMIYNHPAMNQGDFPPFMEEQIARLNLDPVSVEVNLARGAGLDLEAVVAEILAYPGPPWNF